MNAIKTLAILCFSVAATTVHAMDAKSVAVATQASMMSVVNRSLDSGLCSMPATASLRKAAFKMHEANRAGDHEGAMKIAYDAYHATKDECGMVKTSISAAGAVGYFGTHNNMAPTETLVD